MSAKDWLEKDYYKALGVTKSASASEIKKSYRKLARELHPDKKPGDAAAEARFKEVSEAYDVLSDDAKRREYDEQRELFANGAYRGGFPGAGGAQPFDVSDIFGNSSGGNLGDLFGGLFGNAGAGQRGGSRHASGPQKGRDVNAQISLSFDEAVHGATLPLKLTGPGACVSCHGSGAKAGTSPRPCPQCGGSGYVSRNQGAFGFSEPCRDCQGTGRVIDTPCPDCGGAGVTNHTRTITVRVPAGIRDGAKLRLAGKGMPGERGGISGDLFVTVGVATDHLFGRSGDDLTLTVPISYPEAALGATIRVPTLDSSVMVKLAPGTASGQTLRVRGRGIATAKHTGDLLVTVEVAVPARLTEAEREALQAYAQVAGADPRPGITAALAQRPATATSSGAHRSRAGAEES